MEDFSDVPQTGPSINRKGGVRLHPVRDGVIPLIREAHIRQRDQGGNLFAEVTDPSTGFCTGVTSPLLNTGLDPVISATPMVPEHNPSRDSGTMPQKSEKGWMIGNGSRRRMIRTVDDGDALLPGLPRRKRTRMPKGGLSVATGTDSGTTRERRKPIPVDLLDAWIRIQAAKKGRTDNFKITKEMRRYARLELARQRDIAEYCGEVQS